MNQEIDITSQLRDAFGQYSTGVTVMTTRDIDGNNVGMTANSFASVSLDPPLITWSIAKTASHFDAFTRGETFAVQVLKQQQLDLARQFAQRDIDRFAEVKFDEKKYDIPLLHDYLARFVCREVQQVEAGDHYLIIARIYEYSVKPGRPLIFSKGQFQQLAVLPR